jgi:hypothetical protein
MTRVLAAAAALAALESVIPSFVAGAPAKDKSISVSATYLGQDEDLQMTAIRSDGLGGYAGLINGGTTDFSMTFGFKGKPPDPSRSLYFDLREPLGGAASRGVVQAFVEVHAIVRGVGALQPGGPYMLTNAAFKWKGSDGLVYRIRFEATLGVSQLKATRIGNEWFISTRSGADTGKLLLVTSSGEQDLGNYRVPVFIRLQ